jgi:long-chain acyl-CoA synthetase
MILTNIQEAAHRYPHNIAIQVKMGERYQQYTYQDLIGQIASVARALSEKGISAGDRVALLSENRPEWIIAYLAVVSFGAVIVPLDAQLMDKEVALLVASSEAAAIFVSTACRQKLPKNYSGAVISFDPGEGLLFSEILKTHSSAALSPAPSEGAFAALLYTSGTTGDPKGVMLSQGNLASNADSINRLGLFSRRDNLLCLLPLHHTYAAMGCMLLPLSVGATVTILNSLKGPDIISCMRETDVTALIGVPQLFAGLRRAIVDEIQRKPAVVRALATLLLRINGLLRNATGINIGKTFFGAVHAKFGRSFRLFASGGARLDPEVYSDMADLGFLILEGYGLTETSPVCTFNPLAKQKAGSIGVPIHNVEVRIANPDENGQGELIVQGPNVMLGYYKKPQETAEVLRDGWFHTGDLGYRDRDGYFFITGRSKEMIVLPTGKKIFPEELETFYKQIPAVKEICLLQGERGLEAAVVPDFDYLRKKNLSNSRETIAFEIEDLAKDLAPYKHVTGLKIFKDPLPVTRLGKLRRSMVKELYQKDGEPAETTAPESDSGLQNDPVAKKLLLCLEPFSAKKKIMPEDNLELDLGLDSLSRVELVVNLEKSFGINLPDSFGSEIFTVKDTVLKLKELMTAGPVKTTARTPISWAEILSTDPPEEITAAVTLEPGPLWNAVRYALTFALTCIFRVYNRLSVRGKENLPEQGPYIIAPNHLSLADAPAVIAGISWKLASQTFFLGATEYFGGPVSSRIARALHVIPVDMDARLYGAMQLSAYVLRRKKILCVFPEGSRSRDGSIKEFKKGVGIIAKELKIPVVPVAIKGTYEMLPTGKKFPYPVRVTVTFGKPLYPGDLDYDGIVQALYKDVVRMLGNDA